MSNCFVFLAVLMEVAWFAIVTTSIKKAALWTLGVQLLTAIAAFIASNAIKEPEEMFLCLALACNGTSFAIYAFFVVLIPFLFALDEARRICATSDKSKSVTLATAMGLFTLSTVAFHLVFITLFMVLASRLNWMHS